MRNPKRMKSDAQERRIARSLGAKQHAGSGSGKYRRNDMHTDGELVECKRTDNERSIRVSMDDLEGVWQRADIEHRLPVVVLEIGSRKTSVVLLRYADYEELRDRRAAED